MADIVKEYGKALYSLAEEEGLTDELLCETRILRQILSENPDFVKLISSPAVPGGERLSLCGRVLDGRVHRYLSSFVKLMVQRKHGTKIPDALKVYEKLWYEKSGISVAEVISAVPLTGEEKSALLRNLEAKVHGSVEMHCTVDASLLGGMTVRINGILLDGSLRSRMHRLKTDLSKKTV